jgi:molecular chaperone GrpE
MNIETEHGKMQDPTPPQCSEPSQATEADSSRTDAANQNAPLSQDAVMNAATTRIAELEAEAAELKDRWMRSEAEIANVRARSRREVDETRQYAVQKFATDVVEAADNLRRGIDSLPSAEPSQPEIVAKLREGLEGLERGFHAILERNGIRREDPTGKPFDPKLHQAMAEQESEVHQPGTVMHAWSPAWTLNGRLLRPAMVVVAKAPPAELAAAGAGGGAKLDTTA